MLRRLTALWKKLKMLESGERFQTFYREQRDRPPAVKAAFFGIAIISFAAGVVFVFIPASEPPCQRGGRGFESRLVLQDFRTPSVG